VFRTPAEREALTEGSRVGTKRMHPNALGIFERPAPKTEGDLVLPRAMTDGESLPYIRNADKDARVRRNTSMLDDPELSKDETLGADYWDAIRRSDNPKTAYSPSPKLMGKRK
jgi:hypothetical protein